MSTAIAFCTCGCQPCVCTPPSQLGSASCLPAACLPRPTFFDGQVIGSADLNAVVDYARNQQALLARLLGGWGILGGMRVDAAPGLRANKLGTGNIAQLGNNPQIIAGTQVQVSPGVAIDAAGNRLVLCAPVVLDIAALAVQTPQAQLTTATCAQLLGPECVNPTVQITATEFFLVAELMETPARPVGRVNGPGSCDPVVGCQFSRTVEDVRLSLISSLADTYQFTGCADATSFSLPGVTLGTAGDPTICRDEVFAFIDNVQGQLASICCSRPVVVLGRVMLTRAPGSLAAGLPFAPQYLVVSDGYPCRKPTFQVGWFTKTWPNVICNNVTSSPVISAGSVVQTAGDNVRGPITITASTSDFLTINSIATSALSAQLAQLRLSTSSLRVTFGATFTVTNVASAQFRVLVDGVELAANGIPFLSTNVDTTRLTQVNIANIVPPSILGEARAHQVVVQVSLTSAGQLDATGLAKPATMVFDPSKFDGASVVIQEIAG